jgi:TonB family protein
VAKARMALLAAGIVAMPFTPAVALTDDGPTATDVVSPDYDEPPRPLKITRPKYPPLAFERGIEGTVVLELRIDEKGRVARVRVKRSVPELDDAAIECVKAWKFKPARKDGRSVETVAEAPITFKREAAKDTKS